MSDKKFIIVPPDLFEFLHGVAIEIYEDDWELDDLTYLLYDVYVAGRNDITIDLITTLEGTLVGE